MCFNYIHYSSDTTQYERLGPNRESSAPYETLNTTINDKALNETDLRRYNRALVYRTSQFDRSQSSMIKIETLFNLMNRMCYKRFARGFKASYSRFMVKVPLMFKNLKIK